MLTSKQFAAKAARRAMTKPIAAAAVLLAFVMHANADPSDQFGQMGKKICKGPHIRLTPDRPANDGDQARARTILSTLQGALAPYRDSKRAIADGYVPFLPDVPQDVYHFANHGRTVAEYTSGFAVEEPGSLLYVKRPNGEFALVGAMFSAPEPSTDAQLDQRIPLSVTHWHAHVNVCLPVGITLADLVRGDFGADGAQLAGRLPEQGLRSRLNRALNRRYGFMANGRFGFEGSIAEPAICEASGGHFIPQAWGWMAHVYLFNDDLKVAFGQELR
jgi:hypothetical protein